MDDHKPGHVIHWVEKGGAAEYGGLNDGDRLTAIDSKNVIDLSYEEVIAILDRVRIIFNKAKLLIFVKGMP